MSIRNFMVQYVGNVLNLPEFEREVDVIVEYPKGTRYVKEKTCSLRCEKDNWAGGWWSYYGCGYKLLTPWDADDIAEDYCPKCGGRIEE